MAAATAGRGRREGRSCSYTTPRYWTGPIIPPTTRPTVFLGQTAGAGPQDRHRHGEPGRLPHRPQHGHQRPATTYPRHRPRIRRAYPGEPSPGQCRQLARSPGHGRSPQARLAIRGLPRPAFGKQLRLDLFSEAQDRRAAEAYGVAFPPPKSETLFSIMETPATYTADHECIPGSRGAM